MGRTPSVPTRLIQRGPFDADAIVHGLLESLFASQVAFGCSQNNRSTERKSRF
jgi:hypothetical protein